MCNSIAMYKERKTLSFILQFCIYICAHNMIALRGVKKKI